MKAFNFLNFIKNCVALIKIARLLSIAVWQLFEVSYFVIRENIGMKSVENSPKASGQSGKERGIVCGHLQTKCFGVDGLDQLLRFAQLHMPRLVPQKSVAHR